MKELIMEEEILKTIKEKREISRLELSKIFNLTPARISKLIKNLLAKEIIIEKVIGASSGGRPPVYLGINHNKFKDILGINFSSHGVVYITVGKINGEILKRRNLQLKNSDKEKAFDLIDSIIKEELTLPNNIGAIAIVMAGIVDPKKGLALMSPHYTMKIPNLKDYFQTKYALPVLLENDVRGMTAVEKQIGQCKTTDNFVIFNVSSGVGSASCINRQISQGHNSMAGEVGHIVINTHSIRKCSCGKRGCLEAECSEEAIIKKVTSEIKIGKYSSLKDILHVKGFLTMEDILLGVRKKDFLVIQIMTEALEHIATGLNILISILDPEKIILVGSIFSEDFLLNTLKFELNKLSLNIQNCKIEYTKLGEDLFYASPISIVIENIFENKKFTKEYLKRGDFYA